MMNLKTSDTICGKTWKNMGKHIFENKVRSCFINCDRRVFFTEKSISDYC